MCNISYGENSKEQEFQDSERNYRAWTVIKGKGQNPSTKRKTGKCNQWKAIGSCSEGESCSFLHKPMKVENARGSGLKPANERVRRGNEQASSAVPKGEGTD